MNKWIKKIVFLGLCAPMLAWAEVVVSEPWIPEAPPTAQALGAFMLLSNTGTQPVKLLAAEVPDVNRVELHLSVNEQGMHQMIPQPYIEVPAQGQVALKPGSYHVMLIGLKKAIRAGDVLPMTLVWDNGSKTVLDVPVMKRADMMKKMPMMSH